MNESVHTPKTDLKSEAKQSANSSKSTNTKRTAKEPSKLVLPLVDKSKKGNQESDNFKSIKAVAEHKNDQLLEATHKITKTVEKKTDKPQAFAKQTVPKQADESESKTPKIALKSKTPELKKAAPKSVNRPAVSSRSQTPTKGKLTEKSKGVSQMLKSIDKALVEPEDDRVGELREVSLAAGLESQWLDNTRRAIDKRLDEREKLIEVQRRLLDALVERVQKERRERLSAERTVEELSERLAQKSKGSTGRAK